MRRISNGLGLVLGLLAMTSCGSSGDEDESANGALAENQQAIIGGEFVDYNVFNFEMYVYGYVGKYGSTGWFGQCSGTYLGTIDGWAIGTTVRHCIVDWPDFDVQNWTVTTDLAPGRAWDQPPAKLPPPHLSTPAWVAGDWWAHPGMDLDQAIVQVRDDSTFHSGLTVQGRSALPGLTFMSESDLAGSSFVVYGYGKQGGTDDASTGVLKYGTNFVYNGPSSDPTWLKIRGDENIAVIKEGDSGGSIIKTFMYRDRYNMLRRWPILVGVLGSSSGGVTTSYVADMVQTWLGYLTLSPISNPDSFFVMGSNQYPRTVTDRTNPAIRLYYNSSTRQLSDASRTSCLQTNATPATCNASDPAQQWVHSANLQLRHVSSGKCLDPNGYYGTARTVSCANVAEQAWVFRVGVN